MLIKNQTMFYKIFLVFIYIIVNIMMENA